MEIAKKIRDLMRQAQIPSIAMLSEGTGIASSVLWGILNEKTYPRPSTLRSIAAFFSIDPQEFIDQVDGKILDKQSFESTGSVIKFLMRESCINEHEIAHKTGISQSVLNNIINGHTKNPQAKTLEILSDFFSISIDQLRVKEPLSLSRHKGLFKQVYEANYIPIIPWQSLLLLPEALSYNHEKYLIHKESVIGLYKTEIPKDYMLMEPLLFGGTSVIVDYFRQPTSGDLSLTQTYSGDITPATFIFNEKGIKLRFPSLKIKDIVMHTGKYRCVGTIIEIIKND
jgi:transcriptional regulator with XRE-family HTH domain